MMSSQKIYGVGWLNFYVRFRFPIALILGVLALAVNCLNGVSQGFSGDALFWLFVVIDFG